MVHLLWESWLPDEKGCKNGIDKDAKNKKRK